MKLGPFRPFQIRISFGLNIFLEFLAHFLDVYTIHILAYSLCILVVYTLYTSMYDLYTCLPFPFHLYITCDLLYSCCLLACINLFGSSDMKLDSVRCWVWTTHLIYARVDSYGLKFVSHAHEEEIWICYQLMYSTNTNKNSKFIHPILPWIKATFEHHKYMKKNEHILMHMIETNKKGSSYIIRILRHSSLIFVGIPHTQV